MNLRIKHVSCRIAKQIFFFFAIMRWIITFNSLEHMLAPFLAPPYLYSGRRGESIRPFPLWIWDKREAVMAGRRQGEQRWRGSLMAVINDNGPEESWDTGATYIIPSHQSVHLCGLFSANRHTTVSHTEKKHLICSQSAYHQEAFRTILYGSRGW